jgi:protease secretion system membrane fusion protein
MESVAEGESGGVVSRIDRFFDRVITGWNPYHPEKLKNRDLEPVTIEESPIRRRGTWLIVIGAVGFFIWSVTAPIDQGSSLIGQVTVAGYRKAVQHPGGGVVTRVLVNEGSHVQRGQVLVKINPLETDANVANLEQDYINTLVSQSRAKAELLSRPIVWDPELATLNPVRVAEAKSIQQTLFRNRQSQFQEQIRGMQAQLAGLSAAITSHRVQLDTLSQELTSVQDLSKQGYVPKSQVNTTLRSKVEQQAQLEDSQAETGKIRAQIAGARSQYQSDIAKELAELDKNRDTVAPKLRAARFSQSLSEIRSPVTGTVVNLKVFTEGGVITPGETLMEVVPDNGLLMVEAKVPPQSIDSVKIGQEADVRFTAFNSSTTPVVRGTIKAVGVDKQKAKPGEELRENEDYYLAQVEVSPEALKVLNGQALHPGMPADVLVRKGQRTFMSYLLKPLTDKLVRAFRE